MTLAQKGHWRKTQYENGIMAHFLFWVGLTMMSLKELQWSLPLIIQWLSWFTYRHGWSTKLHCASEHVQKLNKKLGLAEELQWLNREAHCLSDQCGQWFKSHLSNFFFPSQSPVFFPSFICFNRQSQCFFMKLYPNCTQMHVIVRTYVRSSIWSSWDASGHYREEERGQVYFVSNECAISITESSLDFWVPGDPTSARSWLRFQLLCIDSIGRAGL